MCFAIHHFGEILQSSLVFNICKLFSAGRVVYDADGFLEKNKNFLPAEVIQLVRQSQYDM